MSTDFRPRVLPADDVPSITEAIATGAGDALRDARAVDPGTVVELVDASGLRGRGGAGFPVARKWRTVVANSRRCSPRPSWSTPPKASPGRSRTARSCSANPYRVIEGALIAAHVVGADSVIIATKASFTGVLDRLRRAVTEADAQGWTAGVPVTVFAGPDDYLYGEETALLEIIDGRHAVPAHRAALPRGGRRDRRAPKPARSPRAVRGRRGDGRTDRRDRRRRRRSPSNVETFANVPAIVVNGADWFRELGTAESPGTIVCTVSGATDHPASARSRSARRCAT